MIHTIQIALVLLAVVAAVGVLARRLRTAPSVLLVLVGILLALIPGLPPVAMSPELVLTLVLPPLIYWAGVQMSWPSFRANLRPIALLAIGCVGFTAAAVAAVTHWLLGLPWAVAFVLGAIVSPPDTVAPIAITRPLGLPRRLMAVLEGEGLANDATALILYRFAVAAVATGAFSLGSAAATFGAILVGETLYGIAVGWGMLHLRRLMNDPRAELTLALLTPYIAFWVPEELGGSGVLATVAAGLFTSWHGPRLISAATRLQGTFFWDLFVYLIEGLVFLLTGLQARTVLENLDGRPLGALIFAALVTVAVVIVVRFIWVYPATYLPRWLVPAVARRDPPPPWQQVFAVAFTGIRGVVSLAAALAIPLTIGTGEPFPERNLILFLAFSVIVVTLIGQGLILPGVIRALNLQQQQADEVREEAALELDARIEGARTALERLERLRDDTMYPAASLDRVGSAVRDRLDYWTAYRSAGGREPAERRCEIELALIAAERARIYDLLRARKLTDESRRRIERELDLEEARIRARMKGNAAD